MESLLIRKAFKKARDLGAHLRRHNRLFSLVGAVIVFVTFIVKDGLREQLRDVKDSLSTAESVYLIRNDFAEAKTLLSDKGTRPEPRNGASPGPPVASAETLASMTLDGDMWRVLGIQNTHKNLTDLIDKIPGEQADKIRVQMLHHSLFELVDVGARLSAEEARTDFTPNSAWLKQVQDFDSRMTGIVMETHHFAGVVFLKAERTKANMEERYNVYTWVSYGLYSLGWGLALFSRLFDVNEVLPAE